jgi:hypothetical protein
MVSQVLRFSPVAFHLVFKDQSFSQYHVTAHCVFYHLANIFIFFWGAETNQELIMAQGGIGLLARTADDAEDPQTLRMVAGAIANLCGNGTSILDYFKFCSRTFSG